LLPDERRFFGFAPETEKAADQVEAKRLDGARRITTARAGLSNLASTSDAEIAGTIIVWTSPPGPWRDGRRCAMVAKPGDRSPCYCGNLWVRTHAVAPAQAEIAGDRDPSAGPTHSSTDIVLATELPPALMASK
jgi:hypothetical protein